MLSRRFLVHAAFCGALPLIAQAGLMRQDMSLADYRDFALNLGDFTAGATDVVVDKADGTYSGTIALMPSFDAVNDSANMGMVSASFGVSAKHVGAATTDATFGSRLNRTGQAFSVFGDTYRAISYATTTGTFDGVQVMRYSKIFLDAAPVSLASSAEVNAAVGTTTYRMGVGLRYWATGPGTTEAITTPAGSWPAGGTAITDTTSATVVTAPVAGVNTTYAVHTLTTYMNTTARSPLEIGTQSGDSGSPYYIRTADGFRMLGVNSYGLGDGYGKGSGLLTSPEFYAAVVNAYAGVVIADTGGATIALGAANTSGAGQVTQGATTLGTYLGLASGVTAATATDAQLDATRDLVFSGAGNTVRLDSSVSLGAGALVFNGGGTYTLTDGGVTTRRLNHAGYIVNGATTVVSQLTATTGDDWRKLGTGTLRIEGSGANGADLSIGEGLVELNRTGGAAARNVRLVSGRGTVRLLAANQISGDVIFGLRGGVLDLYGQNFTDAAITHFDEGATIANTKAGATSTFTFNGTGAATYWGAFTDGGTTATGLLKVVYAGGAGNTWTLTGEVTPRGGFDVGAGGTVVLAGEAVRHADSIANPTAFNAAVFDSGDGAVNLATGSTFTIGRKASANGAFAVADAATLRLESSGALSDAAQGATDGATLTGTVNLAGTGAKLVADVARGFTVTSSAGLSGAGFVSKKSAGTLVLLGASTHTGGGDIETGTVEAGSLAALGTGAANWTVRAGGSLVMRGGVTDTALSRITATSAGVLALDTDDLTPAAVTGHDTLYIGAAEGRVVHYGTAGIALPTSNGGWRLGGGGGELVVDGLLTGATTLYAGNGQNGGILTLTNTANDFTGGLVIGNGIELRYTDDRVLGTGGITIGYATGMRLGSDVTGRLARVSSSSAGYVMLEDGAVQSGAISLTGRDALALGAVAGGGATITGAITPGAAGYRFGGPGLLRVSTALTGANALTVDGQNTVGGVIELRAANNFTGGILVRGYDSANLGGAAAVGSVTLRLAAAGALGNSSGLTLSPGGTFDLAGYSGSVGKLTGTAGGVLTNSADTDATLTVTGGGTTFSGTMTTTGAGRLNLTKSGSGTLTLSGTNTHVGTLTIGGGTVLLTGSGNVGRASTLGAASSAVVINTGGKLDLASAQPGAGIAITLNGGTLASSLSVGSDGTKTIAAPIAIGSAGGTISLTGFLGTSKITGALSGSGALTVTGAGGATPTNLTLNNVSGFSGNLTLNAGTLSVVGAHAGHAGRITVASGATLALNPVNLTTQVFSGGITGGGLVKKDGFGTVKFTGASDYTGGTLIQLKKLVTAHTAALGTGAVNLTGNGGDLQIGDGVNNTLILGSGARFTMVATNTLTLGAATSRLELTGAGGFDITGGTIDLNGVFDNQPGITSYVLITGGTGTKSTTLSRFEGYDAKVFSSVAFSVINGDGVLSFTAVPEPSTYGLAGAASLAALALVRRRRRGSTVVGFTHDRIL